MNSEQIENLIKDWHLWPGVCSEKPIPENLSGLVNGLTNSNVLLTCHTNSDPNTGAVSGSVAKQYVIRLNAQNAQSLYLNRTAEWHIHQSIAQYNICTPYVYRDPKDRYWIRPFIEDKTLHETLANTLDGITSKLLNQLAKKLKLIHSTPISKSWPRIDLKQRTDHYWQQIFKRLTQQSSDMRVKLENLKYQLDSRLKTQGYGPRLCHMDPNPNNWITDHKDIYLIDWEYAAIGNPAWDIAVLCDTFELTESQQDSLLEYYGNRQINKKQLNTASNQMKYISALWYCVQGVTDTQALKDSLSNLMQANCSNKHLDLTKA
jgi:thiamine kinase